MNIRQIKAEEILDSRGNPTIKAFVFLEDGTAHSASVPSGASRGAHEAVELRDHDLSRYEGAGVLKAVENINQKINKALINAPVEKPDILDQKMIDLDGTENKSSLGANAILAVSLAICRAGAHSLNLPLWKFINQYYFHPGIVKIPRLMVNIINGGAHAGWNLDLQEYLIIPVNDQLPESIRTASEIFHALGRELANRKLPALLGDEGGYSPSLPNNAEALDCIISAATATGRQNRQDYQLAIDAAASGFYRRRFYHLKKDHKKLTAEGLSGYYLALQKKYGIFSFEDPFEQEDWKSFAGLTRQSGKNFLVVGDDLTVTNPKRIKIAAEKKAINAIIIKPNQIGTLWETVKAIKTSREAGWQIIISHRSGDTQDAFIADLSYGAGADFLKSGSVSRSERTAKYNRLMEITKINYA